MVTKGIIQTIDFNGNTCTVRLPYFETASINDPIVLNATLMMVPGVYNGYKPNDVVLVAFEDGQINNPVVIGKLFLGTNNESAEPRGAIDVANLKVGQEATIPVDTKLTYAGDDKNRAAVAKDLSTYKTVADIIKSIQNHSEKIGSATAQLIDDGIKLGAKVDKVNDGSGATGFGWELTDSGWAIFARNSDWAARDRLDLMTIDSEGTTFLGQVKILDYPIDTETRYMLVTVDQQAEQPTEDNDTWKNWVADMPSRKEGYYIWTCVKTVKYVKDPDNPNTLTEQTTYSKPVRLSGVDGEKGDPGIGVSKVIDLFKIVKSSIEDAAEVPAPTNEKYSDGIIWNNDWLASPDGQSLAKDQTWWTCIATVYTDNKIKYSAPIKNNAYALAQGKSTNYYSDTDPADVYSVKEGDCWFDTGYVNVGAFGTKAEYLGKFVISTDDTIPGNIPVNPDEPNADRYIPAKSGSTKLIKIMPENINNNKINIEVGTTAAYETGNLKQREGGKWEDIAGELVTNKLTANYINAMDITSKKMQVLDSNDDTLFLADGINGNGEVNIGGFTVDSNRLYAGNPGTSNGIELASFRNLIAYKSNNQGVASSYAVSKITVNKATNLTVYIRSYAESSFDYTMISKPNAQSYPTSSSSSYVKAHTSSNQKSGSTLADYTKVEYYGLKQNDWIYVVYKKDGSTDSGTDTGYLLIPETTDISITAVGDTYYFVRDTSLDTKEAGASLKVGSNFSVDSTGAIKSTSGTIGGFEVTSDDLHTADKTIGDNDSLFLSSNGITDRSGIGGSSDEQTWSITAGSNFGVTKSGKVYANDMVITGVADTISIGGTGLASSMHFKSNFSTNPSDCYIRANEIKNTGRLGYNIVFEDQEDKQYSASISIKADRPSTGGPYVETHYAWEQGIELRTYNPADPVVDKTKGSGALANNAALRIGYYKQDAQLPGDANKHARGFLGDVWCPTGIFRCKNGNIVPYIYGYKSGLSNEYSDAYEYGFYFDSSQLKKDSWASWYYGDTFTGIDCVIVSMGLNTMYGDTKPESLIGSKANENSFYFVDHRNKYVYWCNDTGNTWTVDVFIVGYKQRAAGTFIGDQEIK